MSDIIRMEEQCAIYARAIMDQDKRLREKDAKLERLTRELAEARAEIRRLQSTAYQKSPRNVIDEWFNGAGE